DMVKLTKLERVYFKALEEAEENYNRDKIKFQKGMISILDFLISQEVLTSSRVKYENIRLTLYNSLERYRSLLI
ncbi:MAG: TolC family protein, partial [Cetobacterium sp.]